MTRNIHPRLIVVYSAIVQKYLTQTYGAYTGRPSLREIWGTFKESGQWSTKVAELTVSAGQACMYLRTSNVRR